MRRKTGFTAVEITLVVSIIGILGTIATVNTLRANRISQATLCSQSLERLDAAKIQAAFEFGLGDLDTPTLEQLAPFFGQDFEAVAGNRFALCPAGGIYTLNRVCSPPTCSLANGPGQHEIQ